MPLIRLFRDVLSINMRRTPSICRLQARDTHFYIIAREF